MKLYHLFEYNQAKTAQVFGNKLVTALANDRGAHFPAPLGTSREYLRQKDKIGAEPDEASKQLIVKDILNAIEQADPTSNKEYAQWLAKCYANEAQKLEDITSKGMDWLKKYHQFKVKKLLPDNLRNIANIKFSQLYDIVANDELNAKLDAVENAPSKNKGQAETVFDNERVRIIVPLDEAGACYYGQGTQWCTAARNNNMFDRYNKEGRMYILLPKNPQHDGEKYQLHFPSGQYMDERDDPINLNHILQDVFPGSLAFFKQVEPEIGNIVLFADDAVLAPLLQRIGEMAMEKVNDMISEYEQSDNYYYQSLLDSGYGDEEGNIDWERVAEDDVDYLSYDDGAREFYNSAEDAVNLTPAQARQYAEKIAEDYDDDMLPLRSLEKTVAESIDENISEDEGGETLKKFVNDKIYITQNKETGKLTVEYVK